MILINKPKLIKKINRTAILGIIWIVIITSFVLIDTLDEKATNFKYFLPFVIPFAITFYVIRWSIIEFPFKSIPFLVEDIYIENSIIHIDSIEMPYLWYNIESNDYTLECSKKMRLFRANFSKLSSKFNNKTLILCEKKNKYYILEDYFKRDELKLFLEMLDLEIEDSKAFRDYELNHI